MSGTVDYKMKNIRHQNRQLNMRKDFKRPRHVYFDDDGNVLSNVDESDEVRFLILLFLFLEGKIRITKYILYGFMVYEFLHINMYVAVYFAIFIFISFSILINLYQ